MVSSRRRFCSSMCLCWSRNIPAESRCHHRCSHPWWIRASRIKTGWICLNNPSCNYSPVFKHHCLPTPSSFLLDTQTTTDNRSESEFKKPLLSSLHFKGVQNEIYPLSFFALRRWNKWVEHILYAKAWGNCLRDQQASCAAPSQAGVCSGDQPITFCSAVNTQTISCQPKHSRPFLTFCTKDRHRRGANPLKNFIGGVFRFESRD